MKQMSKWSVLLVFALVCFFIQTGWAKPKLECELNLTADGPVSICEVVYENENPTSIIVSEDCEDVEEEKYEIVGLAFEHLKNFHNIVLEVNEEIYYLLVHECPTEQNEVFKACKIQEEENSDLIILFPPNEKTKNITPGVNQGNNGYQGGRAF